MKVLLELMAKFVDDHPFLFDALIMFVLDSGDQVRVLHSMNGRKLFRYDPRPSRFGRPPAPGRHPVLS